MELLVSRKTLNQLGSRMNDAVASKPSGIAMKLMEKMGWKEGQGLGKNETGLVKHIVVEKREEKLGLGSNAYENLDHVTENWWHSAFSNNLTNIKNKLNIDDDEKKSKKKKSKKEKSKKEKSSKTISNNISSDPPSYEEMFKATGGVRLGMRARREQKGKILRTEGINEGVKTTTETMTSMSTAVDVSESGKHKYKTTTTTVSETVIEEKEVPKSDHLATSNDNTTALVTVNDRSADKKRKREKEEDCSAEKKEKKSKKKKKKSEKEQDTD